MNRLGFMSEHHIVSFQITCDRSIVVYVARLPWSLININADLSDADSD